MSTSQAANDNVILVSGYARNATVATTIPIDILHLICFFLRVVFDFEIIGEKYGTKDVIELEDIDGKEESSSIIDNKQERDILGIVISINSGSIKVGFSGEDVPMIVIPNVISRFDGKILIGHEVKDKMNINLSSPIQYGNIDDWDGFKAIIMRIFSKLIKHKKEFAVLISECVGFTKQSREKLTKFMFEQVGVFGFFCFSRAALSLYANGRITGIVILSDYHCTDIVSIYEGYPIDGNSPHTRNATMKIKIGRRDVLRNMEDNDNNDAFDIMYNPKLSDNEEFKEYNGIHKGVYDCIQKCDFEIREEMYGNMILAGINTIDFKDIQKWDDEKAWNNRFEKELRKDVKVPMRYKVNIICPARRDISVWVGGSILSSLSTFTQMWMTTNDYNCHEASYIHERISG